MLLGTFCVSIISVKLLLPQMYEIRGYIKCLVIAAQMGVLLGGSVRWVQKYVVKKEFSVIELLSTTIFIFVLLKFFLQHYFLPGRKICYFVTLFYEDHAFHMKALVDTGNHLIEPISKKAVCIVEKDFFEKQWEKEGSRIEFQPQRFRAIPYHAVGTQNGILNGYEMDRLVIHTDERKIEILKPMIGISEVKIGNSNTYQMILQPELLREGAK